MVVELMRRVEPALPRPVRAWWHRRHPMTAAAGEGRGVEILRYTLDLGRLADRLATESRADSPGKMVRLTATALAYDTVLVSCCAAAGLPEGDLRAPLSGRQRLDAELDLLQHDIEW